jgi:hypothetical protein
MWNFNVATETFPLSVSKMVFSLFPSIFFLSSIILKVKQMMTRKIRDKFHLCLSNLCNLPRFWQTCMKFIPNFTRCHVITYCKLMNLPAFHTKPLKWFQSYLTSRNMKIATATDAARWVRLGSCTIPGTKITIAERWNNLRMIVLDWDTLLV